MRSRERATGKPASGSSTRGSATGGGWRADGPYSALAESAFWEFCAVADYIWKAPRLVDNEVKIELQKLRDYFPNDPTLAAVRWRFEGPKLRHTFPYMIAVGNLLTATSLFETHLLLLAAEIEKKPGPQLNDFDGQGTSKIFAFFKGRGIPTSSVSCHEQVLAALKIRNCLVHASGLLAWSRDERKLRRFVTTGTYLSPEHRKKRREQGGDFDELQVVSTPLGDRLQVSNEYSFLVVRYFRDYLMGLCNKAGGRGV